MKSHDRLTHAEMWCRSIGYFHRQTTNRPVLNVYLAAFPVCVCEYFVCTAVWFKDRTCCFCPNLWFRIASGLCKSRVLTDSPQFRMSNLPTLWEALNIFFYENDNTKGFLNGSKVHIHTNTHSSFSVKTTGDDQASGKVNILLSDFKLKSSISIWFS